MRNELLHAQSSVLVDTDEGAKYLIPSNAKSHANWPPNLTLTGHQISR